MCLAVPAEVVEVLEEEQARVSLGGVRVTISLALLDAEVYPGDMVLIHVGFALGKINTEEATRTLATMGN